MLVCLMVSHGCLILYKFSLFFYLSAPQTPVISTDVSLSSLILSFANSNLLCMSHIFLFLCVLKFIVGNDILNDIMWQLWKSDSPLLRVCCADVCFSHCVCVCVCVFVFSDVSIKSVFPVMCSH